MIFQIQAVFLSYSPIIKRSFLRAMYRLPELTVKTCHF